MSANQEPVAMVRVPPSAPRPAGAFARFFHGMAFPWKGLALAFHHPRLLRLAFLPIVITTLLVALLIGGAYHLVSSTVDRFAAGHHLLGGMLSALFMALVLVATYYLFFTAILSIANAPFCAALSDRAEAIAAGRPIPRRGFAVAVSEALRGLAHTLMALGMYLGISLPISLFAFLLPPLAPFIWLLALLVSAYFFAYGYLDYPLSSRLAGFGEKWNYIGKHRAESLGFGTMIALLVTVPVVNLLIAPFAAVGAALLHVELERDAAR